MENLELLNDLNKLIAKKSQAQTEEEYIQILVDIKRIIIIDEELININPLPLSDKELEIIEKTIDILHYDYSLKLLSEDQKIAKNITHNLHFFYSLDHSWSNEDYLKDFKEMDLKDIAIDFYNSIDKEFGNIVSNIIKQDNLMFSKKVFPTFEGFSVPLISLYKSYAIVSKNKNRSKMLQCAIHELGHMIEYYFNRPSINIWYNNFVEVIPYTYELLFFDYLQKQSILNDANELEKEFLENLNLLLVTLKLFLKKTKINGMIVNLKIPNKYNGFLEKYINTSIFDVYTMIYGSSIAYLFLEQYQNDRELMVHNLKDFIKNYLYRSDYENINSYGLSLAQIKNNKPIKKALQKYSSSMQK